MLSLPPEPCRLLEIRFDSAQEIPTEAYFTIKIGFFLGTTGTTAPTVPATLTDLKLNIEDIDSNQYVQVEVDDFTSTRLAPGRSVDDLQEYVDGQTIALGGVHVSELDISDSARRYHARGGSTSGDPVAETDKHVLEVTYSSVSSITLRLGAYEAGGGSFDLDFKGFTFVTDTPSPTEPRKSEPTNSSAPGIHLDLQANVGSTVSGSSALIEGQGLQRSSAYALRLGPSGQVLETGTVSRSGGFSDAISLPPGLAPGR